MMVDLGRAYGPCYDYCSVFQCVFLVTISYVTHVVSAFINYIGLPLVPACLRPAYS
jgi:hypothetical protein